MKRVSLPIIGATQPASKWRWVRRLSQLLILVSLGVGPFLGGWQRLERAELSSWEGAFDLHPEIRAVLPDGDTAHTVYEVNQLLGGGTSVTYVDIPVMDPVAAVATFSGAQVSVRLLTGFGLALLIGLFGGRIFCGWFCPFGTISRLIRKLQQRLPWHPPTWKLPPQRWLRFVLLAGGLLGTALGMEMLLYLMLPHLLVQQSVYSLWLMGGGGAILGWLLGLLGAGLVFGPTTYCATLCPTGAGLNLLGRFKRVRLVIDNPENCGQHCQLCSAACWLSLDPASGDPGPDCDSCARCVSVCPKDNLRVGVASKAASVAVVIMSLWPAVSWAEPAHFQQVNPRMLVDVVKTQGEVRISASIVDITGVRLDADDPTAQVGHRFALTIARGPRDPGNELGKMKPRETYGGPLALHLYRGGSASPEVIELKGPSRYSSTPDRAIYRQVYLEISPNDRIELQPIPGWVSEAVSWRIPMPAPGHDSLSLFKTMVGAFLLFGGLLSVALALPDRLGDLTV